MARVYPYRQMIIGIVAVFIFTYVYDMLVHGGLMGEMYMQTAAIWRPESEMPDLMPLCFFLHLSLAAVFTSLFIYLTPVTEKDSFKYPNLSRGLFFGVHLGLILGVGMSFMYVMLPVPFELGLAWFAAGLLKGIGVGLVLSFLLNRSSVSTAA